MPVFRPPLRPTLLLRSTLCQYQTPQIRTYAKKQKKEKSTSLQARHDRQAREFLALREKDPSIPPYRQIRADYDDDTVTVYQAYSSEIAIPALTQQKLDASKAFKLSRGSFIKLSFTWVLWRSDYTLSDPLQAHLLAIKLKRSYFEDLISPKNVHLNQPFVTRLHERLHMPPPPNPTRALWDPERDIAGNQMPHRALVLLINRYGKLGLQKGLLAGNIVEIRDETERARTIGKLVKEGRIEEAEALRLPEEVYEVGNDVYEALGMGYNSG